jgi:hypothetical protein
MSRNPEPGRAPDRLTGRAVRVVRRMSLVALGVVIYAVCIGVFGGYPQFHTGLATWVVVGLLSVTALVIWIRDERRRRDD